jgi:transposase InsO family protein
MPWTIQDTMSLREEFVRLALQEGANRRELCLRYGISPQTGYKWLARYAAEGKAGLADRSRRPLSSPGISAPEVEEAVLALRREHPAWGGRKISRRLKDLGSVMLAPSTVSNILHRHGLIGATERESKAWQRFEHDSPNALWQADFKGHFETLGGTCHPLTVLDDHSRFNLVLQACSNTKGETVRSHFETAFRRYGLPVRMNFDNGAPWGTPKAPGEISKLAIWLIRLGIRISFSSPYHPQTNGKEERFHRSLKAEVLNGRHFESLPHAQRAFDRWRPIYNDERPHEALQMATPLSRYQPSPNAFPEQLPPIEYGPDDVVIRVRWNGELRFQGKKFKVSAALQHLDVAVRPKPDEDGVFEVYFAHHRCQTIDMQEPKIA